MGKGNFTDEFKRDAVRQITERGYPVSEVSQRLGVSAHLTLPPTSIQREVDSGGWFGRSGRGERRGLARSLASSAAPDPVAG